MKKVTSFAQVKAGFYIRAQVQHDGAVLLGVVEVLGKKEKAKKFFQETRNKPSGEHWVIRAKDPHSLKNQSMDEFYLFEFDTITSDPFKANNRDYFALYRFDSRTWVFLKTLYSKEGTVYNRAFSEFITGYTYLDDEWEAQCDDWAYEYMLSRSLTSDNEVERSFATDYFSDK